MTQPSTEVERHYWHVVRIAQIEVELRNIGNRSFSWHDVTTSTSVVSDVGGVLQYLGIKEGLERLSRGTYRLTKPKQTLLALSRNRRELGVLEAQYPALAHRRWEIENGRKHCGACDTCLPGSEFEGGRGKDGLARYCYRCTRERAVRSVRGSWSGKGRHWKDVRKSSRISAGTLARIRAEMIRNANGRCQLCGRGMTPTSWRLDHAHDTQELRGVVCPRCNAVLARWDVHGVIGPTGRVAARLASVPISLRKQIEVYLSRTARET